MTQALGPVEVRTYQARSQAAASAMYATEASAMAQQGLLPTQQVWSGPRYARLVITPIILVAVGWLIGALLIGSWLGIIVGAAIGIVYLFVARPVGTMTVTYTRQQPVYPQQSYAPQGQSPAWR